MTRKSSKKASTVTDAQNNPVNASEPPKPNYQQEDRLTTLMRRYTWGVQDMDTRRIRKNGWNDVINSYMGKIPVNWPYNSMVTDPRIRTTILEKTSRLLNAKLQGRLVPRHDADVIKAKINNALLDFQWDFAEDGGSMLEKAALCDQFARIFGAAFVLNYWDVKRETNEVKVIDPRDIFIDGAATHVKNAKWIQVREFTTFDKLEQRGYNVEEAQKMAESGEITSELRSTRYESIVKANRGLVDRTGMIDDLENPVVEVVTEWGFDKDQTPYCTIFLPKYAMILSDLKGDDYPYKHGKLPISMLRYYPLIDDVYGESEVEAVLPLQRAINAIVCGFLDECNIKIRPPLKISATGVRIETIEYGPGAKWIMNSPSAVEELEPNGGFISAFQAVYPALLAAYNTAMGDTSLGVSDLPPFNTQKTATEVVSTERQQTSRDQYNQLYLGEFLKDVMMQWMANNRQFLFDDPTKKTHLLKILGRDNIQAFQQLGMDDMEVPDYAVRQIADTVAEHPNEISGGMINNILDNVRVPKNPILTNPKEKNPDKLEFKSKLDIKYPGQEADLYITPEDFDGEFDYIPDVKSMAAGMGLQLQQARQKALEYALNPEVISLLQTQGQMLKIKELLVANLEDAGYRDAEALFETVPEEDQQDEDEKPKVNVSLRGDLGLLPPQVGQTIAQDIGAGNQEQGGGSQGTGNGPTTPQPGGSPLGAVPSQGMGVPQGLSAQAGGPGISQPQGL